MFRVVVFTDAPEVAVISHKWWQQDEVIHEKDKPRGIVFWPPCKTSSAVDRLLKSHAEPNQAAQSPWTRHPAISYFASDDLLVARRKAQQAEEESDLASEAEVGETSTRTRRKNPRFDDEDSEEENRCPVRRETAGLSRPPLAPRDFSLDNGSQGKRLAGSRHVTMGGSSATTSTTPTTSVPIRHRREAGLEVRGRTRSPEARTPMRTPVDEPSTSASGSCAKQSTDNRILLLLGKTLKKLESIESITLQNRAAIEALKAQWTTPANKPLRVSPLQTLSELRELDERLKSRAQFLEMVEQLSGWCTMAASDLDKNVRAVMRATVSDVLSEHLSLKGKNGKTPIEGTVLFDVLCETLRRCGGAERSRVGKAVGAWLSGSRDRSGKRLKRMKGVEAETTRDNSAVEAAEAAENPAPVGQEAGNVEGAELPPPEQRPQPNADDETELPMHLW